MALSKNKLKDNIMSFVSYPDTFLDSAESWSEAFNNYCLDIIPASITHSAAKEAFKQRFLTMGNGIIIFPQCFVDYAQILATGMQPAFTATAPIGIPNFTPVYSLGYSGATSEDCINLLVSIIHSWMLTGIATNNSSGATIPWS